MAKGKSKKNVYKAGEIFVKDGKQFMMGADGEPHRVAKTQSRPKADWQEIESLTVPYSNGEYIVKKVENKNAVNGKQTIVTVAQWLTDADGNSKIKNKSGTPIPKKAISLSGESKTLKGIAKAIQKLAE
jgi:hypothetical protein